MTLTSPVTVDRTPKPCLHPRANHQHGTSLAYSKDGCRCVPCSAAHSRHFKLEHYRTVTGTHSYVPADRARAHVDQLLDVLTVGQIEQRSGVNRTAIRVLVGDFPGRPASKRITRTTQAALLAVTAERLGTEQHGLVDGTGTRRRLRALVALGWPVRRLRSRLGISSRTGWELTRPDVDEGAPVRTTTRDAIRRLYDELNLTTPPPSRATTRARHIAVERGWPPPGAWDDDSIDDPDTEPDTDVQEDQVDEFAVDLVCDGQPMHLTGRDLEAAVERLGDRGLDVVAIAARCRSDETTVRRIRNTVQQRNARAARREGVA